MNKIAYSGRVVITKLNKEAKVIATNTITNSGTQRLLEILINALDRNASNNLNDKPYSLRLGTNNNGYQFIGNLNFSMIGNPVVNYSSNNGAINKGTIEFTFYISNNEDITSGSGNILLLLCNNNDSDNVLAYVDTGSSTYKISNDETHVIKWRLTLELIGS